MVIELIAARAREVIGPDVNCDLTSAKKGVVKISGLIVVISAPCVSSKCL
jgi:hypothetical protein